MDEQVIQDFASENNLDVRPVQPYHLRLMDEYGNYVLDVYIKRKKGRIVQNSVLKWKGEVWSVAHTPQDLQKLLK